MPAAFRFGFVAGSIALALTGCDIGSLSDSEPEAVELVLVSGDEQSARVGSVLPERLVVRVQDEGGAPVEDVEVAWSVRAGGGDVQGDIVSGPDGTAAADWVLGDEPGEQEVRASVAGLGSVAFHAVATAIPFAAAAVSARWQWREEGAAQEIEPAVFRVSDDTGYPAAGVDVEFVALAGPGDGHAVERTRVVTDEEGHASAGAWSVPDVVGGYTVRASPPGGGWEWQHAHASVGVYRPVHFERVWTATTGYTTCGLDSSGAAYCWASDGQPRPVGGGMTFARLSEPGSELYALSDAGTLYRIDGVDQSPPPNEPPTVLDAPPFVRLVSGQRFRCGLTADGTAYCWGNNGWGQTGSSPDAGALTTPTEVAGDPPPFVDLAAGWRHACGLTADGAAYCWGNNGWGQVGDGSTETRWAAVRVQTDVPLDTLSLGNRYSCGLDNDGAVHCWGREFVETAVGEVERLEPVPVAEGSSFVELASGGYHTCGRQADGRVLCWGLNAGEAEGAFGDGTWEPSGRIRETPGPVHGDHVFHQISASWYHTCGITDHGLACWGRPDLTGFPWYVEPPLVPVFVSMP